MKKYSFLIAGMMLLLTISLTSCSKKVGCYYSEFYQLKSNCPSFAKSHGQLTIKNYNQGEVYMCYTSSATKQSE